MWTLVSILVLLVVWGIIWRAQPKLAFGVLLGLPLAWAASRLTAPYFSGAEEIPVWLPPLLPAAVATLLFVYGVMVWRRADRLPPPLVRDAHGSGAYGGHGAHEPHGHSDAHAFETQPHGSLASAAGGAAEGQGASGDDLAVALELARAFVGKRIAASDFATEYRIVWRRLRDSNRLATANPYLHRALKVVFDSLDSAESSAGGELGASRADELAVRVATVLDVVDHVA